MEVNAKNPFTVCTFSILHICLRLHLWGSHAVKCHVQCIYVIGNVKKMWKLHVLSAHYPDTLPVTYASSTINCNQLFSTSCWLDFLPQTSVRLFSCRSIRGGDSVKERSGITHEVAQLLGLFLLFITFKYSARCLLTLFPLTVFVHADLGFLAFMGKGWSTANVTVSFKREHSVAKCAALVPAPSLPMDDNGWARQPRTTPYPGSPHPACSLVPLVMAEEY